MGMFEYVDYRGPLPKTVKPQSRLRNAMLQNLSQSKSVRLWETEKWGKRAYDEGCLRITVTEDGQMLDPDGNKMLWTGFLRFYGSGSSHRGWEFTADVADGMVEDIVKVRA